MGSRGRKTAASHSVLTPFRIDRAAGGTKTNRPGNDGLWSGLPPDWFQREVHPLLCAYVRHVVSARFVAQQIDAIDFTDLADPKVFKRYSAFLRMEAQESAAIARLATKLRLTNQSLTRPPELPLPLGVIQGLCRGKGKCARKCRVKIAGFA